MDRFIIMDTREPVEIMKPLLEELGFTVSIRELPVADYIIYVPEDGSPDMKETDKAIAITMKSHTDFLDSLYRGHMHNEIMGMLGLPENYLIMMILWKPRYGLDKTKTIQANEKADMINLEYLPVMKFSNRLRAVEYMSKLYNKYSDRQITFPLQFRRRVELAGSKNIDPILKIYMNLPGVGDLLARAMFEKYPTVVSLLNAMKRTRVYDREKYKSKKAWRTKVWYASIDKMGPTRANDIENVLLGPLPTLDDLKND
jgi:ERCC4-type nuclease